MTYYIRKVLHTWSLYHEDGTFVDVRNTRDEIVDLWAKHAKLPVCSICRCVHGSEIQHECE